jgi:Xaa-Pro aminopeptidase
LYVKKTHTEVAAIRLANQVAGRALDVFRLAVVPGRTEAEVAAAVEASILCQTGTQGIHLARGFAFVQSGSETAASGRYNRNTGRKIMPGEPVLIELATCVNGYWSDLTRSVFTDKPQPKLQEMLDVVRRAQRLAIAEIQPGLRAWEIDSIARAVICEAGFEKCFTHATGHHTGFRYHDPGPALAPGVWERLEPGMIITVEPGIYSQEIGGGIRIEDNVLVTSTGHEVLSQHDW